MNKTRRDWSGVYKCYKGKRDSLTAFYSLATGLVALSVSFYCVVYYIGIHYPSAEVLDEREFERRFRQNVTYEIDESEAGPSAAAASNSRSANKVIINQDDSDDDPLIA